jgi:hypothetical protein
VLFSRPETLRWEAQNGMPTAHFSFRYLWAFFTHFGTPVENDKSIFYPYTFKVSRSSVDCYTKCQRFVF